MRILIHANAPTASTGYGVQCKHLARRLRDDGHDVAVSCTWGLQGGARSWEGIQLYPSGFEQQSNDVIHNHALHWFRGDPLGGWIIVLTDLWAMYNQLLKDFNVVGWCPVDHFPVPPTVAGFFHRTEAVPLAMSGYGHRLLSTLGLPAHYAPLAVDTTVYRPTPELTIPDSFGEHAGRTTTGREVMKVPEGAFVVGMTAMNKDPNDRKGFNEAFRAFGAFWRTHQDAVLYVHTDKNGMGTGFNLTKLARDAAIPPHAIVFPDPYTFPLGGFSDEMMAAVYTGMDVLLAPSRGEGFCVPLIEAQACGTPVIANGFSAQAELVGAGWTIANGHPLWDPAQEATYVAADIGEIVDKLGRAYDVNRAAMAPQAIEFASRYDADRVYEEHWRPFLAILGADPEPLPLERQPIPDVDGLAVIVPAMRKENLARLADSFYATNDGSARLVIVADRPIQAAALTYSEDVVETHMPSSTFAEKVNLGFEETTEPWVLLVGDDVEFHPGWIQELRKLSDRYDVIGTNDSLPGRTRNPDVADGSHADHFAVRRSYVDEYGGSLDGPGVLAPDCYTHFFTDKEMIELAKARDVFAPCLTSIIEHHHPGYDGGELDLVYVAGRSSGEADQRTYLDRLPLIGQQRRTLGKVR